MANLGKTEFSEVESMMNTSLNLEMADEEACVNGFNASFANETGKFDSGSSFGNLANS